MPVAILRLPIKRLTNQLVRKKSRQLKIKLWLICFPKMQMLIQRLHFQARLKVWKVTLCAAVFWTPKNVLTVVVLPMCARLFPKLVFCLVPMDRHCLPEVKHKRWSLPRSAPAMTNNSLMHLKAHIKRTSCCIITSRPILSVKQAESGLRVVVKLVTVSWHGAP